MAQPVCAESAVKHQPTPWLLTAEWGHGSPITWASLLTMFSLLHPSVLDLDSGTRQTDRQTDRQRSSLHNALPYGSGGIIKHVVSSTSSLRRHRYDVVVMTSSSSLRRHRYDFVVMTSSSSLRRRHRRWCCSSSSSKSSTRSSSSCSSRRWCVTVMCRVQTMLDPSGTLTQQAAESLRISQELLRLANETAERLRRHPGLSLWHLLRTCHSADEIQYFDSAFTNVCDTAVFPSNRAVL